MSHVSDRYLSDKVTKRRYLVKVIKTKNNEFCVPLHLKSPEITNSLRVFLTLAGLGIPSFSISLSTKKR